MSKQSTSFIKSELMFSSITNYKLRIVICSVCLKICWKKTKIRLRVLQNVSWIRLVYTPKPTPQLIMLLQRAEFGVYVTYCENKPKSESFIWTYTHSGGTFFKVTTPTCHAHTYCVQYMSQEMQEELKLREDIASFLIKPVQRITKYQLLLRDLFLTSQKLDTDNPMLEKSLQLMKDVPKQANDAMALSMIVGYPGNIHANGEIVIQVI